MGCAPSSPRSTRSSIHVAKKEGCAAPVENGAAALFVPSDEHVKAAKQAAINAFVMQTGGDEALHNQADAIAAGESTALDLSQISQQTGRMMRVPGAALQIGHVESLGLSRSIADPNTASFNNKLQQFGDRDLKRIDLEGNRLMLVPEVVLAMPKLESHACCTCSTTKSPA